MPIRAQILVDFTDRFKFNLLTARIEEHQQTWTTSRGSAPGMSARESPATALPTLPPGAAPTAECVRKMSFHFPGAHAGAGAYNSARSSWAMRQRIEDVKEGISKAIEKVAPKDDGTGQINYNPADPTKARARKRSVQVRRRSRDLDVSSSPTHARSSSSSRSRTTLSRTPSCSLPWWPPFTSFPRHSNRCDHALEARKLGVWQFERHGFF